MKKRFSSLQLNLFIVFSLVFIVLVCAGAYFAYQERLNLISYFFPPAPEVVATECGGYNDPLIDIGANVKITVRNNGGHGKIRITSYITQDSIRFQKSIEVYINDFETKDFLIPFDEVMIFGGELNCQAEVKLLN